MRCRLNQGHPATHVSQLHLSADFLTVQNGWRFLTEIAVSMNMGPLVVGVLMIQVLLYGVNVNWGTGFRRRRLPNNSTSGCSTTEKLLLLAGETFISMQGCAP